MIYTEDLHMFDQGAAAKVTLIEILSREKEWLTIDELTKKSYMTQRTIKKYIYLIQEDLADFGGSDPFQLEYDKRKGYHLSVETKAGVEAFILYVLKNTLSYQLMYNIFFERIDSAVQFAQENYTSESTVWRIANEFRRKILPYQIEIKKGKFILVGDEYQVRHFSYSIFWLFFKGSFWPFEKISYERVQLIIEQIETVFKIRFSWLKQQQIAYYIAICVTRNQKGHPITETEIVRENTEGNPLFQLFLQKIAPYFVSENWQEAENAFLFCMLLTQDQVLENPEIREQFYTFHKTKNTQLHRSLQLLRSRAIKEITPLKLTPEKEDKLRNYAASTHIFCQLFTGFGYSINGSNYWNQIREKYPNLLTGLSHLIDELATESNVPLFKEKRFLTTHYFIMYATVGELPALEKKITILLQTDLPLLEEKRVVLRLENAYVNDYNLEILTLAEKKKPYDLILATSKISQELFLPVPTIIFDTELTKKDYVELDTVLRNLLQK